MRRTERHKVLLLIKGLGLGGAERLLVDSLPFLNRERFDYHVAYILPWKRLLVDELRGAGMPVHCLGESWMDRGSTLAPARWLNGMTVLPVALRRLLDLQRRERFNIIQADLPFAGILARLASRWSPVPVVYTEHNLQERYHAVTQWANATTYHWNRHVIAVSGGVADSIERSGLATRTRVVTLLNGVPVEQIRAEAASADATRVELGISSDHLVVGTVAVFRSQKRLGDWLQVASRVAANRPNVTFLLVGAGPLESEIRAQIDMRGLTARVLTPGFRADGRRLIGAMDAYLMTSEFEGLPMAMLEAMALAIPVVATNVGGIPEVLESGVSGFMAPVGAIDQLESFVTRLLDDRALRLRLGKAGAARVESEHHVRRRVSSVETLYQQVLGTIS